MNLYNSFMSQLSKFYLEILVSLSKDLFNGYSACVSRITNIELKFATHTIENTTKWSGITAIGMVESERYIKGITTVERRHYIASIAQDAEMFAHAVRSHWAIENKLHWVLDVTFKEDASRVRRDNCAENLGVIRHVVINILRQDKTTKGSVKGLRYKCALNSEYANKVLDGLF